MKMARPCNYCLLLPPGGDQSSRSFWTGDGSHMKATILVVKLSVTKMMCSVRGLSDGIHLCSM